MSDKKGQDKKRARFQLDEKYWIETDQYNFTLYREVISEKTGKPGKPYTVGYFGNMCAVLRGYMSELICNEQGTSTVEELIAMIERVDAKLDDAALRAINVFNQRGGDACD